MKILSYQNALCAILTLALSSVLTLTLHAESTPVQAEKKEIKGTPFLGLLGAPLIEDNTVSLGLKKNQGFYIFYISPDSPAAKAGLHTYSVIESIAGKYVNTQADLKKLIRSHKVGDTVKVKYFIKGEKKETEIKLSLIPNNVLDAHDALALLDPNNNPITKLESTPQAINMGFLPVPEKELKDMPEEMAERIRKVQRETEKARKNHVPTEKEKALTLEAEENRLVQSRSIAIIDPKSKWKFSLYQHEAEKELNVYEADGKLLFSSPYNNEADRQAVPEVYRKGVFSLIEAIAAMPFS